MPYEQYAIAAGYNNVGGLTNIETVKPSGDTRYFCTPVGYGNFDEGVRKKRLDNALYIVGEAQTKWTFGVLTRKQYEWLRTTFCSGGYSGKVTINTTTDLEAYSHWNATLEIKKLTQVQRHYLYFEDYDVSFTGMKPI